MRRTVWRTLRESVENLKRTVGEKRKKKEIVWVEGREQTTLNVTETYIYSNFLYFPEIFGFLERNVHEKLILNFFQFLVRNV